MPCKRHPAGFHPNPEVNEPACDRAWARCGRVLDEIHICCNADRGHEGDCDPGGEWVWVPRTTKDERGPA